MRYSTPDAAFNFAFPDMRQVDAKKDDCQNHEHDAEADTAP